MSGLKQELLAYAEYLKQSGILYIEPEELDASSRMEPVVESEAQGQERRVSSVRAHEGGGASGAWRIIHGPNVNGPTVTDSYKAGKTETHEQEAAYAQEKTAREQVAACTACPLHLKRTQTVYGTGSLEARIVFIGEAPGAEEDRTGVPFVGRAGQLLTKMIESIGFSRDEVYICNTVKCRPPDNRDPTPDEKAACRSFLEEQLKILRPQILVGLGAHAAGYLTGLQTSLGKMRKQWHEFEGVPTMVTYHPAFLLRSPGMKKQAWEDLLMLSNRYNELNPDDTREVWTKEKQS